jgi:hypothetical protein
LGWLRSDDADASDIRERLEQSAWLLPGAVDPVAPGTSSEGSLEQFDAEHTRLMAQQFVDGSDFSPRDAYRLRLVQMARDAINDTVAAERLEKSYRQAVPWIVAGAVLAAIGATVFAFVVNQAARQAELTDKATEKLASVDAGELLPKAETKVRLVVPSTVGFKDQKQLDLLGVDCDTTKVDGVLFDVGKPPAETAAPDHVMRIVTLRQPNCEPATLFVPPAWVIPRPDQKAGDSGEADASTTTETTDADSEDAETGARN